MKTKILSMVAILPVLTLLFSMYMPQKVYAELKSGAALVSQSHADCAKVMNSENNDGFRNSIAGKACSEAYRAIYSDPSQQNLDRYLGSDTTPQGKCTTDHPGPGQGACRQGVSAAQEARKRDLANSTNPNVKTPEKLTDNEIKEIAKTNPACTNGNEKLRNACLEGFVAGYKNSKSKSNQCKQSDTQEKNYCNSGYDAGKNAKANGITQPEATPATSEEKTQADCDATTGVVLSWIICPIIDLGANMSDTIFRDIIEPMLANVPVSTNPEDGSYKAWSSFRLIANILLVATLLAVVFSQAKGGGK